MNKFDLIIIGGGAAGIAAAIKADEFGVKTAIINAGLPIGGTCVNVGCVPTKFLLEVCKINHLTKNPRFNSIKHIDVNLDFQEVMKEKDELVLALRKRNYEDLLSKLTNIKYVDGYAKFISERQIEVNGRILESDKFIIATGSSPKILPIPGLKEAGFITNREALELKELPETLLIIGGGPIGLEFAQIFSRLGSKVILIELMDRILPQAEPVISEELKIHLQKEFEIYTNTKTKSIEIKNGKKSINIEINGNIEKIEVDEILLATGVVGNTNNLGLKKVGIGTDKNGFIKVDEELKTSKKYIFAVGDVKGAPWLETVAAKEGNIACQNLLENTHKKINYSVIPYAVFTSPQVASVGLKEEEYMKQYGTCKCSLIRMDNVPKGLAIKDTRGLIFMVIHHETKKIMGVHIVAPNASEIIHEATLAVKYGLSIDDIIDTVHIFPTFSESIKIVSQSFNRDMSKMSCCVE